MPADAAPTTFAEVWEAYEAWAVASGKTDTALRTIRGHGQSIAGIADLPVATTPLPALAAWCDGLVGTKGGTGRTRTVASVAKNVAALRAALNRAGIEGPWRGLKAGVKKRAGKKVMALMGDEREAFLRRAADHSPEFSTFARVLALTGARPGEIRAALVEDASAGRLHIRADKTGCQQSFGTLPILALWTR